MPKSKRIGRNLIIQKAREHAGGQKDARQAFDSFLSGVKWILDELDGKTIVHERTDRGDFVRCGTVTGSFAWPMRNVEYENPKAAHD